MKWHKQTSTAPVAAIVAALLLAGCAADPHDEAAGEQDDVPHGYIEGAEETAEPQSRLVMADGATGSVHILDLITEETAEIGRVEGVSGLSGDGRFAYVAAADRETVQVFDSGAWTVDHGDHSHYYRAEMREVGAVDGARPGGAAADTAVTALPFGGTLRLLDRERLAEGGIGDTEVIEAPGAGPAAAAVPYGGHVLVPGTGDGDDVVAVHDRTGEQVGTVEEPCPDPAGRGVTRRGAVFGCADGALVVAEEDGAFTGEKIAYPGDVAEDERARVFSQRPGSATLAAPAGDDGVWVLDVTAGSLTRVDTGPVVAANAVGEGAPLLALTPEGVLHAYDTGSGEQTARSELLDGPLDGPGTGTGTGTTIQIDTARAYVNDAAADTVYEIDYNDDLRVAREFPLDFSPTHMVETGR
ncbi:ABC transporter [Nocardiopsis sediminis]|uniref:ABC transporter n=1 Tax=Nocardiopsis sediminis TaxID=1778267 RepID=A0ABV8FMT0_9ACTN